MQIKKIKFDILDKIFSYFQPIGNILKNFIFSISDYHIIEIQK